jgi:hypothetical protein
MILRVRRHRQLYGEPTEITQAGLAERVAAAAFDRRPFESTERADARYLALMAEARAAQVALEALGRKRPRRRRR